MPAGRLQPTAKSARLMDCSMVYYVEGEAKQYDAAHGGPERLRLDTLMGLEYDAE